MAPAAKEVPANQADDSDERDACNHDISRSESHLSTYIVPVSNRRPPTRQLTIRALRGEKRGMLGSVDRYGGLLRVCYNVSLRNCNAHERMRSGLDTTVRTLPAGRSFRNG